MKKKITSLKDWKVKKKHEEELARGRKPLYVSHSDGKIYGSPNDYGTRVAKIKTSLEKINRLMEELKKINEDAKNEN